MKALNKRTIFLVSLAVTAILSWAVWGVTQQGEAQDQPDSASEPLTSARESPTLCLNTTNASELSAGAHTRARESISSALPAMSTYPVWKEAQYGAEPARLIDCPDDQPYPQMERPLDLTDPGSRAGKGTVETPLPYRVVIFILSEEEAEARLGQELFGRSAYESVCEGHACAEVTTALYLRESILTKDDDLSFALARSLGLERPREKYPQGHPEGLESRQKP